MDEKRDMGQEPVEKKRKMEVVKACIGDLSSDEEDGGDNRHPVVMLQLTWEIYTLEDTVWEL